MRVPTLLTAIVMVMAQASAHARPIHIVAFGDSMTSGWLVAHDKAYPAQLQTMLRKKGYDVVVKNAGVPGDTAAQALGRLDAAIDPGTDIAIVEFGINDRRAGASLSKVRGRLARIVRELKKRGISVLVIGTGGLDIADVARANDALYVEWKLPPGKYRARDGAHFNAEGYAILVSRMLPQLEKLIAEAPKR